MIQTGFESRVKVQQIIDSQLPEYILDESPKTVDFLKQYYIGQEYQGGPIDITDNLDQYLKLDNLTPEVVVGSTTLSTGIAATTTTIEVASTKGFPENYGLLKINDEVITYTGLTTNTFTGCKRGFCGITSYHELNNQEELVFSDTTAAAHTSNSNIQNLSSLFLKEFYKKTKSTLTPGLEDVPFTDPINAGNFIKESRSLYEAKGTDESFRILFNVLYGETPQVVNLEEFLIKPSSANFVRREVAIGDVISGDITKLVGQTIFKEGDLTTSASIAEVEAFTRTGISYTENKQYYKLSLFLGYSNSESAIQGDFKITPTSKSLSAVSANSSTIMVDSTIGFGQTGTLVSGANTSIYYTSKSINQFFGVSGITSPIANADNIIGGDIYYGYENGDTTKKVRIRLNGVLSEFEQTSSTLDVDEGQEITVKNIGNLIVNPSTDRTYEEIFANSWIYNTGVRYKVQGDTFSAAIKFTLFDNLDRSSLKTGDTVQIFRRGSDTPETLGSGATTAYIKSDGLQANEPWNTKSKEVELSDNYTGNGEIDIRRVINTARSVGAPLEYDPSFSDVQNVYVGSGKTAYVASNSLPSGTTDALSGVTTSFKNTITTSTQTFVAVGLLDPLSTEPTYDTTIRFNNAVPFMRGDSLYYNPTGTPLTGLSTGRYYVDVVNASNGDVKLYNSPALIDGVNYLPFKLGTANIADQKFTLFSQKDGLIGPQKVFKAFSLEQSTATGTQVPTTFGPTGVLINGVEITNYKSTDKIYYGPLTSTNILNQGTDYDVINLPHIEVAAGVGTLALIQPVLTGTMTEAVVDPQGFNVDRVLSIDVTGGNGTAVIEPLIESKKRSVSFDARGVWEGGGVGFIGLAGTTITFLENHSFVRGQEIIYNSEGNIEIGVGIGTSTLGNYANYFANVINTTTISLHNTKTDANNQTNPIGIRTSSGGIQKFQTLADLKTIIGTEVVDGGTFTNRQLRVQPKNISIIYNTVNFENHGFNDGDLLEYKTWGTEITGIVTANQYCVLKDDDNSFKLADAGIGGTDLTNYSRRNSVILGSQGVGEQIFKYPDISVAVNYVPIGGTTNIDSIVLTPTVRGSIVDSYLYEKGTGYGSTTINFESQPLITIKTGKDCALTPVIINGQIVSVNIQNAGDEYYSVPDINIIDESGAGSGAILRPVIENRKITSVVVANTGIGYSSTHTSIKVTSTGKNGKIEAKVRPLTIDIRKKYDSDELLLPSDNKLKYTVCGYGATYRNSFGEDPTLISKIIGWAYDGNPIYGPYGNSDPQDSSSGAKRLVSGYTASTSNVIDRPSFNLGMFVEDYKFDNSGDLDENNGRFSKTPEFPDGVYAYYATIYSSSHPEYANQSQFPYFIGDSYRSLPLEQNFNQSSDFAKTDLVRNTFPYRSSSINVDNDYIIEPNEIDKQKVLIESVSSGSVDEVSIVSAGSSYKVGDILTFDDTHTDGGGLSVKVSSLIGEDIYSVTNSSVSYSNVVFTKQSDNSVRGTITGNHILNNQDVVTVSGFTTSLSALNNRYTIGINTAHTILTNPLPTNKGTGAGTTEIVVADIPASVSVGSSIGIGTETGKILNIYRNENVLTVERGVNEDDKAAGVGVTYHQNSFTFNQPIDDLDSKVNDIVYFNPDKAVGFGTTAGAPSHLQKSFTFANRTITRNVPCGRVYIPNHPFTEGQEVTYTQAGSTALTYVSVGSTPSVWDTPATFDTLVGGSGYSNGARVATTGGTGTELYVTIATSAGAVTGVTLPTLASGDAGRNYTVGDIITITGGGGNATFRIATLATNVPTSSYYIRHPFGLSSSETLYISNATPTTVGLKTEKTGPEILFTSGGSDSDLFSLESNYTQEKGTVSRINTEVTTVKSHGLKIGDTVSLKATVGLTTGVGIGSTDIAISRQSGTGYILVDPIEYDHTATYPPSTFYNGSEHNFNTGDKVYLTNTSGTLPTGLSERAYFVYVQSSKFFQLCETYKDTQSPANIISFTGTPTGTRTFSKINPPIKVIKNNSPRFNLKDPSLSGYDLKFYYDKEFKNEFVSTATTTTSFNITTLGIVGSGINGSKTINYNGELPDKLYYTLGKSGYISTADTTVQNYSKIEYVDSEYNGTYDTILTGPTINITSAGSGYSNGINVSTTGGTGSGLTVDIKTSAGNVQTVAINTAGTGYTSGDTITISGGGGNATFTIFFVFTVVSDSSLDDTFLTPSITDTLKYTTTSTNTIGGVDGTNIISGGSDYKKLPTFVGSLSTEGSGLYAVSKSKSIGNINQTRIINEGFEYSSDPTLRPEAFISPIITINNSNTIGVVTTVYGGSGYGNPPKITIVDTITRETIDSGILEANMSGSAINIVDIKQPPYGLPETPVTLFTTNNDNGVGINTILSDRVVGGSGIFTCFFATTNPSAFAVNDRVFIEGVTKIVGSGGTGFNSADVGYKFGRVVSYVGGVIEDAVKITYEDDFISTNCGMADTVQSVASIIKKSDYPSFSVYQVPSNFIEGEQLISNNIERDLFIASSNDDFIKVSGVYLLSVGEVITGKVSGVRATIENIRNNEGTYIIKYGVEKNIGWSDDIGKLSSDNQVTPDNDYYQNLSYTIKSTKTFDELRSPVNGLLHTSGLKNFADTGITSTSKVGIGSTSYTLSIQDIISDNRVDTINNWANAEDLSSLTTSSKTVKLTNKRLTPYQLARSNEVLLIDNINSQFSNLDGSPSTYLNIENLVGKSSYIEYTIRISNLTYSEVQLVELVILNNGTDITLLKKSELDDTSRIGDFSIVEDVFGNKYLTFTPLPNAFDYDYDLKVLKSAVSNNNLIATQPVGFSKMMSSVGIAQKTSAGIATANIVSLDSSEYESVLVKTALTNTTTNEMSYVEIYAAHDSLGNAFMSEVFVDNDEPSGYSEDLPGTFKVGIMTASGGGITTFFVGFNNSLVNDDVQYKSRIVTFEADAASGEGKYHFKVTGQPDNAERTALYQSDTEVKATNTYPDGWTVASLDKSLFNSAKSIVEVGAGATYKELHQVLWTYDGTDIFSQQGPILSVGPTDGKFGPTGYGITATTISTGIGTCWAEIDGSNIVLKYDPPTTYPTTSLRTNVLTLGLYTENDLINTPNTNALTYGAARDSISIHEYNALNGDRVNKKQFRLTSATTPIFAKIFNPADVVSGTTFTIEDHFFRTGEELVYKPGTTFIGVSSSPMTHSSGPATVPSAVYVNRINKDQFTLSSSRSSSGVPGAPLDITGYGVGNAHELSMPLANSKSVITIDNIIQSPIAFTSINFDLADNADATGAPPQQGIDATRTTFALTGISSIVPNDLLKFEDEYVRVINIGTGTTSVGPITNFGSYNLVTVERGFVGTFADKHDDGTNGRVYRGSYNIVGENINFTEPPRGNSQVLKTRSNLPFPRSEFTGRVFLRNDYSTNAVYDDISDQFTGIGRTFNLTVGGANTTGIGSTGGNAILTINSLFQRPSTPNNANNNFSIDDTGNVTAPIKYRWYVREIASAGSGYSNGTDVATTGGTGTGLKVDITTSAGAVQTVTITTDGTGYTSGDTITISGGGGNATFILSGKTSVVFSGVRVDVNDVPTIVPYDVNQNAIPRGGVIVSLGSTEGLGYAPLRSSIAYAELGIGNSGSIVGIATTATIGEPIPISSAIYNNETGDMEVTTAEPHNLEVGIIKDVKFVGLEFTCSNNFDVYAAEYNPTTGEMVLNIGDHPLGIGQSVGIATESLGFTCDHGAGTHYYPRTTDPLAGITTHIRAVTHNTITINVLDNDEIPSTNVTPHTFVSARPDAVIVRSGYSGLTSNVFPYAGTGLGDISYLLKISSGGTGYSNGTNVATTGGTGTGLKVDITQVGGNVRTVTINTTSTTPTGYVSGDIITISGGGGNATLIISKKTSLVYPIDRVSIGNFVHRFESALTGAVYRGGDYAHTYVAASTGASAIVNTTGGGSAVIGKPSAADYNAVTGVLTLTFSGVHGLSTGNTIKVADKSLAFTCSRDNHKTIHKYPRESDPKFDTDMSVTEIDVNTITVNVGTSPIVSKTPTAATYTPSTGLLEMTVGSGHGWTSAGTLTNPVTAANYTETSGKLVITSSAHGLSVGEYVKLNDGCLSFTCTRDNDATVHAYPRVSDPAHAKWLPITNRSTNTFTIYVGAARNDAFVDYQYVHKFVTDSYVEGGILVGTDASYAGITTAGLTFSCDRDDYSTLHAYPRLTDPAGDGAVVAVQSHTTDTITVDVGKLPSYRFSTNVGINSIPHTYVGRGYTYPWYGDANFGSGYRVGVGRTNISIDVVDLPFDHKFIGASTPIRKLTWNGAEITPTDADYNPSTGLMIVTSAGHGLDNGNNIGIGTNSLTFTCSKDGHATEHTYPRGTGITTDPSYNTLIPVTKINDDTFSVNVGSSVGTGASVVATVGAGGTVDFALIGMGTNYANPQLVIPEPSYASLGVTGVSRLDGTTNTGTGLLLNIDVGAASTVGIGSTLFSVKNWEIVRNGYGFRRGDVFTPVGLVEGEYGVVTQATFEVLDTFSDNFGMWNFGNMDYIDDIAELQDGVQRRFDLKYNGALLSFEIEENGDFPDMNLSNCLFIVVNGTIQEPGVAYNFEGGSSFLFTEAPQAHDNVSIFFYRGTYGQDSQLITNIYPTVKKGDILQLDRITENKENQGDRTVVGIPTSNIVETLLYKGVGISNEPKSLNWTKQKSDKIVNGVLVSKVREVLEPLIFPTGKLIADIPASVNPSAIYLDDASDFDYEGTADTNTLSIQVVDQKPIVAAAITATVAGGEVTALTIVDGGQGYVGATTSIYISAPPEVGVGIGITATAAATITNGVITNYVLTAPSLGGFGYDNTNPPNVLASTPPPKNDVIVGINSVVSYSGPITGIDRVTGSGTGITDAIKFTIYAPTEAEGGYDDGVKNLVVGMPIYITGTTFDPPASPMTSLGGSSTDKIGISTTFDNVYEILSMTGSTTASTRTVTCNILGSHSFSHAGSVDSPIGYFSIGIIKGGPLVNADSTSFAVNGFTNTAPTGLSTYPTVLRRNVGLRTTGALNPTL